MRPTQLTGGRHGALASLPLATGAALVVYLVADLSLALALVLTLGAAGAASVLVWRRTPAPSRAALRRTAATGLRVGIAATAAYDLTRLAGAELGATSIQPFDIWHLFGQVLVGRHAPDALQWTAGTAFHYVNGLGFAIAYVLLARRPRILTALLWSAALNAFMLALYPPWLGLSPVMTEELAVVSVLGHSAYGVVLGSASRAVLARESPLDRDPIGWTGEEPTGKPREELSQ